MARASAVVTPQGAGRGVLEGRGAASGAATTHLFAGGGATLGLGAYDEELHIQGNRCVGRHEGTSADGAVRLNASALTEALATAAGTAAGRRPFITAPPCFANAARLGRRAACCASS